VNPKLKSTTFEMRIGFSCYLASPRDKLNVTGDLECVS